MGALLCLRSRPVVLTSCSVLFNGLYVVMLLAFTYRLLQLRSEPTLHARFTWVHYVVCACHLLLGALPMVALIYGIIEEMEAYQAVWYSATILVWVCERLAGRSSACHRLTCSEAYSLVVISFEYSKSKLHNWTTMGTWLLAFILSAVQLQSMVSIYRQEVRS